MSRRLFKKKKEGPPELLRWQRDPAVTPSWGAEPREVSDAMRARLFEEQQGLCCYCYGSLAGDETDHREHVIPRSAEGVDPFEWSNLALSCEGGNVSRLRNHCDHAKGDQRLRVVHPHTRPTVECARIASDGRLRPNDEDTAHDLATVLRLDRPHLASARKARIQAAIRDLEGGTKRKGVPWNARQLDRALTELRRRPVASLDPWVEQWLESRRDRL